MPDQSRQYKIITMKKIVLFSSAAALFIGGVLAVESFNSTTDGELLKANVETLASSESHWGKCKNKENDCMSVCPECGELVYNGDHAGPAYGIHE